jgi:hypothetical protein
MRSKEPSVLVDERLWVFATGTAAGGAADGAVEATGALVGTIAALAVLAAIAPFAMTNAKTAIATNDFELFMLDAPLHADARPPLDRRPFARARHDCSVTRRSRDATGVQARGDQTSKWEVIDNERKECDE